MPEAMLLGGQEEVACKAVMDALEPYVEMDNLVGLATMCGAVTVNFIKLIPKNQRMEIYRTINSLMLDSVLESMGKPDLV